MAALVLLTRLAVEVATEHPLEALLAVRVGPTIPARCADAGSEPRRIASPIACHGIPMRSVERVLPPCLTSQRGHRPRSARSGSTIAASLHMTIYCDVGECHHSHTLDLEALAAQFGRDYRISDFVARSRCSKCGAKAQALGPGRADPYGRNAVIQRGADPDGTDSRRAVFHAARNADPHPARLNTCTTTPSVTGFASR